MGSLYTEQAKKHLASQVKGALAEHFSTADAEIQQGFVDVFWAQLIMQDWADKEVSDIAGCCDSLWGLMSKRLDKPICHIVNPTMEEHGWVSKGTAILIRQVDMPFLVDSVRLELNRREVAIHTIKSTLVQVERTAKGKIKAVQRPVPNAKAKAGVTQEALIFIEVGLISDQIEIYELKDAIDRVLADVGSVVEDYPKTLENAKALRASLAGIDQDEVSEVVEFLSWLEKGHFTYLGYRELDVQKVKRKEYLVECENSRLGLFKTYCQGATESILLTSNAGVQAFYKSNAVISISKSGTRSNVHRSVYPDYIVVKRFDSSGKVIGEARILGLFTYSVYTLNTQSIPIIRKKVDQLMSDSGLLPNSHDGKNLQRVLETYPRDELFQAQYDDLKEAVYSVAAVNEKGAVRLIMRTDPFKKFVTCIAYVPRDSYNTQVRKKIEGLVGAVIESTELDSTTYFSESTLARAYMVFRLNDGASVNYDAKILESSITDIARGWDMRFSTALIDAFGERKGLGLYHTYRGAFTLGYQENFDPRTAVADIKLMKVLSEGADIAMHFYQPLHAINQQMRFRVMHTSASIELSDVVPILEFLGLRVAGEHPYKLANANDEVVWLHDFSLVYGLDCKLEVATVSKLFEQAFAAVWRGDSDSDGFNRLVLSGRLEWREVALLRAYAAYMKQTAFTFDQDYIADTLVNQIEITRNLVALFKATFDPRVNSQSDTCVARIERLQEKLLKSLEEVENLNEDKILRRYIEVINATLRTNFYQKIDGDLPKPYIALKFAPRMLKEIPEPKPEFEVYVYSPRVEGVHLRGGAVARGGIRWSDRLQDFRTEVLGLVKAQQVKNAVIVPTGAKGGFIAKRQHLISDREALQAEGVECYKTFMRGLLDVTDNYVKGKLVPPAQVVCKDTADPYMVVAADKGTATFSDIANGISEEYNHWLGDAFASGGSQGYDHKKMGITARGAWVSVQRHFRELGVDIQNEPFTVIGIGDMAGDVFGNGMLLSKHIQLTAAFNHLHIFIDPTPDAKASFKERQRLFKLPRSSWQDYNETLISKGGGVFSRSAKSIKVSVAMKKAFNIERATVTPTELITALLKAPVDLIWNGGIGTYVKHSTQTHLEVGDKANDPLRVDGNQLNCRVLGEGGNLGMTQLGRVEYALKAGRCNSDFIDNAAGVDCSDHEVNIKILLQGITASGDLTQKQRNQLLVDMTDEVAELVLNNNYRQTMALSLAEFQAKSRMGEFKRFIQSLEAEGNLNRELEYLPSDAEIVEREKHGQIFTRPELAVLLSYAKVGLKEAFIDIDLTSEPILAAYVETAFPPTLVKKFKTQIYKHRLLKEIVATQVANDVVHILGITAAQRLAYSTATTLKEVAVAFACAKSIFKMDKFIEYVESTDNKLESDVQYELLTNMARRVRRGTRWFLRHRRGKYSPESEAETFAQSINAINAILPEALNAQVAEEWGARTEQSKALGITNEWGLQLAVPDYLFSGLSAAEVGMLKKIGAKAAGIALFTLYEYFKIDWLAKILSLMPVANEWQAKARETNLDELDNQLRALIVKLFAAKSKITHGDQVRDWLMQYEEPVARWHNLVNRVQQEQVMDFAVISVLVGELVDCVTNRIK